MLNKIQIDDIRFRAENGTADSKDCMELLGHLDEVVILIHSDESLIKKIGENIDSFIDVEIGHFVKLDEKGLAKFITGNIKG